MTWFSKNKIHSALLLFFPSVGLVSWGNVYLGNDNYELASYLATFILPAFLLSYVFSLLFGETLAKRFKFNTGKVISTFLLTGIVLYLVFSSLLSFVGLNPLLLTFLTYQLPTPVVHGSAISVNPGCLGLGHYELCQLSPDNYRIAKLLYSTELILSLIVLILSYPLCSLIIGSKRK